MKYARKAGPASSNSCEETGTDLVHSVERAGWILCLRSLIHWLQESTQYVKPCTLIRLPTQAASSHAGTTHSDAVDPGNEDTAAARQLHGCSVVAGHGACLLLCFPWRCSQCKLFSADSEPHPDLAGVVIVGRGELALVDGLQQPPFGEAISTAPQ